MSYLDEKGVNKLWTKCKAKFAPINFRPESVIDYGDTNKTIKIGYSGAGLTASQIAYIAGYSVDDPNNPNEHKIKDISKDVLKSWLGYAGTGTGAEVTTGTLGPNSDLPDVTNSSYFWIIYPNNPSLQSVSFSTGGSAYNDVFYHFAVIQGGTPGSIRYFNSNTRLKYSNMTILRFNDTINYVRFKIE